MPTSARCLQPGCRLILGLLLIRLYCVAPSLAMEFSESQFAADTFSQRDTSSERNLSASIEVRKKQANLWGAVSM